MVLNTDSSDAERHALQGTSKHPIGTVEQASQSGFRGWESLILAGVAISWAIGSGLEGSRPDPIALLLGVCLLATALTLAFLKKPWAVLLDALAGIVVGSACLFLFPLSRVAASPEEDALPGVGALGMVLIPWGLVGLWRYWKDHALSPRSK